MTGHNPIQSDAHVVAARRRRRRRWAVALIVLAVIGAGAYYGWRRDPAAPTYRETQVARGDIAVSVTATGTVMPENRLEIKPPIAGRVEQVLVREGDKVAKGQILAWMSSTERAALLDAARSAGGAELKRWEELYRPTPVMAPIGGTIILRNVESGQTFTNTESILVMADRLTVKAQVDETDIAQIKLKQPAQIVLDAYAGETTPGTVTHIAFEAKAVNNVTTYEVDVLPQRVPAFMRSGMTANVIFTVATARDVLLIPSEAVSPGRDGTAQVWVRGGDGEPQTRPIRTGLSDGKRTEVVSGLAAGDVVLIKAMKPRQGKGGASSPLNPSRRPAGR